MNCNRGIGNFFASYGSFMHKILEMYEKEFGDIYELLPQQIIHRDPNPGNIILCNEK